jgi:hypothetical protein
MTQSPWAAALDTVVGGRYSSGLSHLDSRLHPVLSVVEAAHNGAGLQVDAVPHRDVGGLEKVVAAPYFQAEYVLSNESL